MASCEEIHAELALCTRCACNCSCLQDCSFNKQNSAEIKEIKPTTFLPSVKKQSQPVKIKWFRGEMP